MSQLHHTVKPLALRVGALAAATILATAMLAAPSASAEDLSWGINPGGQEQRSSFAYELEPGQSAQDSFEITNYGTAPISLAVYPADGTTSSSGSLELSASGEPAEAIGSWIKVKAPTVNLAAGEETSVDFSIEIPKDAAPGDYVGGMVSSHIDAAAGTVAVDRRLATQLAIRVGGEGTVNLALSQVSATAPIAWNPFAPVDATVDLTLANGGNLRARGSYTIRISGIFGLASTTRTYTAEELLPGSTVRLQQQVPGLWPLLWQKVEVTMDTEGVDSLPAGTTTSSATFWSVPAGGVILLLLLVAAAITIAVRRNRAWDYAEEDASEDHESELSARE